MRDTRETDAMSDASEHGSRKRDWNAEVKVNKKVKHGKRKVEMKRKAAGDKGCSSTAKVDNRKTDNQMNEGWS